MVNAQEWLDQNYPKEGWLVTITEERYYGEIVWNNKEEKRATINELRINSNELEGELDLRDFVSLKELNCSENKLESIKFPSQTKQLTWLNIKSNNFPDQDLSIFRRMINLEGLIIGNDAWKINQGICNRFVGSLEPLQNMSKLKTLNIENTDIDSGLEYLPDSVKYFNCSVNKEIEAKVKVLERELRKGCGRPDGTSNFIHLLPTWKRANPDKMKLVKQKKQIREDLIQLTKLNNQLNNKQNQIASLEEELQMEREEAAKALQKAQEWRERQLKEITKQKDREIEELKGQLEKLQSQQAQIQVSPKRTSN